MNRFRLAYNYILHLFLARNTNGYGVHSPFLFEFTKQVIAEKHPFYVFKAIENARKLLKKDKKLLNVTDFGTAKNRTTTVENIACRSLKSKKYGQLFFRIINYYKAKHILELGTSLGITTSYLASSSADIRCISLEGCPQIAAVATSVIANLEIENVEIVIGNIDATLNNVLINVPQLDFVFIDANHQSKAVLNYFEQCLYKINEKSVVIVDDIYWSKDMKMAWQIIKEHSRVKATIDLFDVGIIFFNPDLHKKHYRMRF